MPTTTMDIYFKYHKENSIFYFLLDAYFHIFQKVTKS